MYDDENIPHNLFIHTKIILILKASARREMMMIMKMLNYLLHNVGVFDDTLKFKKTSCVWLYHYPSSLKVNGNKLREEMLRSFLLQ